MDRGLRAVARCTLGVALLAAGCALLRSPANVGALAQRDFSVAAGDATDADLHVAFWGGKITIEPADGDVIVALTAVDNLDEVEPRCEQQREGRHVSARLFVDTDRNLPLDDDARHEWTVAIGRRVPIDLDLGLATCEGEVDLGGVPLRRARVTVGAGAATLRFSRPNPIEMSELHVELGAGSFELLELGNARARSIHVEASAGEFDIDCQGEWKEPSLLRLEAGMAGVTIRVPRDLAVRIDARETTFGGVNAPDFERDGELLYSSRGARDAAHDAPPQLSLEIEARFGSVTIVRE